MLFAVFPAPAECLLAADLACAFRRPRAIGLFRQENPVTTFKGAEVGMPAFAALTGVTTTGRVGCRRRFRAAPGPAVSAMLPTATSFLVFPKNLRFT